MSYSTIVAALKTRIEAVVTTAKVHTAEPYTREPPESSSFGTLFKDSSSSKLHTLIVNRTARLAQQLDDGTKVRVTHQLELAYLYALDRTGPSEPTFQANLDAICRDLETGDHTLAGSCHTHSTPNCQAIGESEFYGLMVHDARISLQIAEVL